MARPYVRQTQIDYEEVVYLRDVKKKSFAFIANWIGCHLQTLMAGIKKNGIRFSVRRSPYTQIRKSRADERARELGFESMRQLVVHYRPSMRVSDIAILTGFSTHTIYDHMPKDAKYKYIINPPENIEKMKANLARANEVLKQKTNHNHIWRSFYEANR